MKRIKRILAFFLSICLLFSLNKYTPLAAADNKALQPEGEPYAGTDDD